jgi:hypothetical protein
MDELLRESSFYQVLKKWEWEDAVREGEVIEARRVLIILGRIRFGRVDKATRAAIEAIDDLRRLERLCHRVQAVSSWAELLAKTKGGRAGGRGPAGSSRRGPPEGGVADRPGIRPPGSTPRRPGTRSEGHDGAVA